MSEIPRFRVWVKDRQTVSGVGGAGLCVKNGRIENRIVLLNEIHGELFPIAKSIFLRHYANPAQSRVKSLDLPPQPS